MKRIAFCCVLIAAMAFFVPAHAPAEEAGATETPTPPPAAEPPRADAPSGQILLPRNEPITPEEKKQDNVLNGEINKYHQSCEAENQDSSLLPYVSTQCACTAAKMKEFMTVANMESLTKDTKEGNFQATRVMMLAYIPCLYDSVDQFVYEGCFFDDATRERLKKPRKVCECYAKGMAQYAASKGEFIIPGFHKEGFDRKKTAPNPFAHVIKNKDFLRKANGVFDKCVMIEEHQWGRR